jgi:hypothetical protein
MLYYLNIMATTKRTARFLLSLFFIKRTARHESILCNAHGFWQNVGVFIGNSFTLPTINCCCCGFSTDLSGMRTLGELHIYSSIWLMKMATL